MNVSSVLPRYEFQGIVMNVNSARRTSTPIAPFLATNSIATDASFRELFLRHFFSNASNLTYALLQAWQANVTALSSQRTLYLLSQKSQWEDWKALITQSPYPCEWEERRKTSHYKLSLQFPDGSELHLIFLDHVRLRQSARLDSEALLRSVSINAHQIKVPAMVFVYEFWLKGAADENPDAYRDGISFFNRLSGGEQQELRRYMKAKYGGSFFLPAQ